MFETKIEVPETATHVWKEALKPFWSPGITRLAFYRRNSENVWEVFSNFTGWRKSTNDASWFQQETDSGVFVPIQDL